MTIFMSISQYQSLIWIYCLLVFLVIEKIYWLIDLMDEGEAGDKGDPGEKGRTGDYGFPGKKRRQI